MEEFRREFEQVLEERKALHLNDSYGIYASWDKLTTLLSSDIELTILLLNSATEDEVGWVSEVFEDIASQVKNREYINCLEMLDRKFPNQNLRNIVEEAGAYLEE